MANNYRVAVVGARAVGQEMLRVLRQRDFPTASLRVFATRERDISVDGDTYHVEVINEDAFDQIDLALFAGGDKREGHFGPLAAKRGTVVIDNGDAFRLDPEVPLVVPEVNPEVLRNHANLVANPNCSTIQFVVALKPLHDAASLKRAVVATYQAVSGRGTSPEGSDPVEQLRREMAAVCERLAAPAASGKPEERLHAVIEAACRNCRAVVADPTLFPHPIAGNVIPHISSFLDDGYCKEEMKLVNETRKILDEPDLKITATTVRVPVFNSHAEAVNFEFERPLSAARAREILSNAPGVAVIDEPADAGYPLPLDASGRDEVFVGRIREDPTVPHGLNLWVVSDNLRKGAALNAVQIAEKMIEMGLLSAPPVRTMKQ
ncbi:MAG: aspartate-semialdehyde dehydrogenase [Armatimonadota bacterium]|nr:MAG: aspartate-semialdehyde dehydrogenase [Armatimonadota bacterium]